MKFRSMLAAGGIAAALVVATAGSAAAAGNTQLVLSTTGAGTHTSVHTGFQTNNETGLVVADANQARADSRYCNDCKTVAVAVQIDLASGPVVNIKASNLAISYEYATNNADTCAAAYQFVIAPDLRVSFSDAGKAAIADIKAQVAAEAASTDDCLTITANVASLMDSLGAVLSDPGSYVVATQTTTVARAAAAAQPSAVAVSRFQDVKTA